MLIASALAGEAGAAPPIVTIVPAGGAIELSRALPAGVAFEARLAVEKDVRAQGSIAFWAAEDRACHQPPPPGSGRLALAGDPTGGVLAAELPPLQFGVSYCLQVTLRRGLTTLEAERAARAAVSLAAPVVRGPQQAGAIAAELGARLHPVLVENGVEGAARAAIDRLMIAVARDFVLGAASRELAAAQAALAVARPAELVAADERVTAAQTAADEALVGLVRDALRDLRVEVAYTSQDLRVQESTPQPTNYASIDLGVAVALPFTSPAGDAEPLWMPYLGLNLYFCGVDRSFPLAAQRGGFWRTRFALTVGMSLDEPTLRGRDVRGFLFGKIPFIAAGFRVTQYTRVSLGLMAYEWPDDSPAVDDPDFGGAAFVGYSLDLDLIKWLRGNAAGYGGL